MKDALFPIFCLGCHAEGVWVCDRCRREADVPAVAACPVCHAARPLGYPCTDCRLDSALYSTLSLSTYREQSLIGQMVLALKYEYARELLPVFRPMLTRHIEEYAVWFAAADVIVPVPLHPRRLAERGFNQAFELGTIVAEIAVKPVEVQLMRVRYTTPQARSHRGERARNVFAAFTLNPKYDPAGKSILLIDDVYTTGSTMQECTRVLLRHGAREVRGWSVARG